MLTLTPAYGRDYKSKKAVIEDWNSGKDFVIANMFHPDDGRYCNKEDIVKDGKENSVSIRYKRLTQICVIPVK